MGVGYYRGRFAGRSDWFVVESGGKPKTLENPCSYETKNASECPNSWLPGEW